MTPRPPPYQADTRAKGWRFELDVEQVLQSDTWALAEPMQRPWLLMLWMTAWQQSPCGSLPADDRLIAARLGMPADVFTAQRETLLRGWWLATDGRLYHDTIADRVLAMLAKREAERTRKAGYRSRKSTTETPENTPGTSSVSRGTDAGQSRDSGGSDATSTRTSTSTSNPIPITPEKPPAPPACARDPLPEVGPPAEDTPPDRQDRPPALRAVPAGGVAAISPTVAICVALRQAGIARVNPDNPTLRELVAKGATAGEFLGFVDKAKDKTDPFAYLLAAVVGERKRAEQLREQSIGLKPPGQVFGDNPQATPGSRPVAPLWRQRQALRHLEAYGRFADVNPEDLPPDHPLHPNNAGKAQATVIDVQATQAPINSIGDANVHPLTAGR